jgi:uncharacterized protein (DUF1800 family)
MGDENSVLSSGDAQHFLRRTGFGARPAEVAKLTGKTRGAAADQALRFKPSRKSLGGGGDLERMQHRWFRHILKKRTPALQEKLVLFLHDHFATSNDGVGEPKLMSMQNRLLRMHAKGNFKELVKAINRDGAMIEWLDTERNEKWQPNENYAREFLELFTLGVNDANGAPNYAQEDIVQIARAFTGWRWYGRGKSYLEEELHDFKGEFPARGDKRIFTNRGGFGAPGREFDDVGEGEEEINRVVDIVFDHRDSDGAKTVARWFTYRLLNFFTHGGKQNFMSAKGVVDELIAASGFDANWQLDSLARALFVHDAFWESASGSPDDAASRRSITWPVDFVASSMRLFNMNPMGRWHMIPGGDWESVAVHMGRMGQRLLAPPSVFGWDWEEAWLTSTTLVARQRFARDLTTARWGGRKSNFRPDEFLDDQLTNPSEIVNAVSHACGVSGRFTQSEHDALVDYLSDGNPNASLDLGELDGNNYISGKVRGLFALILGSPAFQTA